MHALRSSETTFFIQGFGVSLLFAFLGRCHMFGSRNAKHPFAVCGAHKQHEDCLKTPNVLAKYVAQRKYHVLGTFTKHPGVVCCMERQKRRKYKRKAQETRRQKVQAPRPTTPVGCEL